VRGNLWEGGGDLGVELVDLGVGDLGKDVMALDFTAELWRDDTSVRVPATLHVEGVIGKSC
jgi:hypothetical protein